MMEVQRMGEVTRRTAETDIYVKWVLDGAGTARVDTGIGFLDHMLTLMAKHGLFDIEVSCKGDLYVDGHHSVEDIGICLGQAFYKALGDKSGIKRFGTFYAPMDEALVMVSLDISGRPYLHYDVSLDVPSIGQMDAQLFEEFFRALAFNAGITLHINCLYGRNAHHIIEAAFKALGRALDAAVGKDPRIKGVPSTKGVL
ncbi:imidazoleglycerol-phosphate dehydratase HisB [Mahella sp.]|uniref:imidazoleglycerol-phosphate dehydratase HisB n=1 Tax=Mahella sp. TaxID=2798721 RepID=UPI0025C17327|nr:imidazoleglycerol-phosphate dehydratase HisB [Mahella sp.]MBZ4665087.1 imidazoleglycerol-phosphate dehydratase [Mahella sp.]